MLLGLDLLNDSGTIVYGGPFQQVGGTVGAFHGFARVSVCHSHG